MWKWLLVSSEVFSENVFFLFVVSIFCSEDISKRVITRSDAEDTIQIFDMSILCLG